MLFTKRLKKKIGNLCLYEATRATPDSISNVSLRAFICFLLLLHSGDCGPATGSVRLQLLTGVQRRGHRQGQRRHDDLFPHQWSLEQLTPAEERRRRLRRFRLLNSVGVRAGAGTADWSAPAHLARFGATAATAQTRFAPRRRGPTVPDLPSRPKTSHQCVKTDFATCETKVPKQKLRLKKSLNLLGIKTNLQEDTSCTFSAFLLLRSFCKAHSWVWDQFNVNVSTSTNARVQIWAHQRLRPTRLNQQTYTTVSSAYEKHKKRCQWRTFSNLWHFLFWLEHQTLANILKIYILYINILESYLWTPRRTQMYKLCHCHVGFSEVVPLLFAPRSSSLFKWIFPLLPLSKQKY